MPEYLDAPPEVEKLAKKLTKKYKLVDADEANIKFVFKYAKYSGQLSYTSRNVGHWRFLIDFDFVIVLWSEWWGEASPKEQEALLFHALNHIGRNPHTGFWEVRKHPIECFPGEVVHFGAWHPALKELKAIVRAARKKV
jgi:hypothetical protein